MSRDFVAPQVRFGARDKPGVHTLFFLPEDNAMGLRLLLMLLPVAACAAVNPYPRSQARCRASPIR